MIRKSKAAGRTKFTWKDFHQGNKPARCRQRGHCCRNLLVTNTLDGVNQLRNLPQSQREQDNYHEDFLSVWEDGANQAKERGEHVFQCEALTPEGLCRFHLEGRKPAICTHSLSPQTLREGDWFQGVGPHHFFHHECGYLQGAPAALREAVRLQTEGNLLEPYSSGHTQLYGIRDNLMKDMPRMRIRGGRWQASIRKGKRGYKGKSKKWARRRNKPEYDTSEISDPLSEIKQLVTLLDKEDEACA